MKKLISEINDICDYYSEISNSQISIETDITTLSVFTPNEVSSIEGWYDNDVGVDSNGDVEIQIDIFYMDLNNLYELILTIKKVLWGVFRKGRRTYNFTH